MKERLGVKNSRPLADFLPTLTIAEKEAGEYHGRLSGYGDHEHRGHADVHWRVSGEAGQRYKLRELVGGELYAEGV